MIVIAISVVVGSVAGYSFLIIHQPSSTSGTTTTTNAITTHTTSHSAVSSTRGQSQGVSTTLSETGATTLKSSSITQTRTSTSGTSSSVTTSTGSTTGVTNATTSRGTTSSTEPTTGVTTITTSTGVTTVTTSTGFTSTTITSTTQTIASQISTQLQPSLVDISGVVSTTGAGTRATTIIFDGSRNYYVSSLVDNSFSISLVNNEVYVVSIAWVGAYPWQHGITSLQLQLNQSQPTLSISWQLPTPDSTVQIIGNVQTTGSNTQATRITFASSHGNYNQNIAGGVYAIALPNGDNYSVSASWSGEFDWQTGSNNVGSLKLNASSSLVSNWNLQTPDSMITLSGNLTASGSGTHPVNMTFTSDNNSLRYTTSLASTHYLISLPNEATYSVGVDWMGEFAWQVGNVSAGDYALNQSVNASASKNWDVQIPDSEVTVSGTVLASGSGTGATQISFYGVSGNFSTVINNGKYSIVLPNTVTYEATIHWSGSYSWQSGDVTYQLSVFAGAGSSSFSASWIVPTPNSTVTVSGSVTSQSGSSLEIRFISTNGQVFAASVVNNQYSIVLPDDMNYTVMIFLSGSTANDGIFELYAAPGATAIIANWIA